MFKGNIQIIQTGIDTQLDSQRKKKDKLINLFIYVSMLQTQKVNIFFIKFAQKTITNPKLKKCRKKINKIKT